MNLQLFKENILTLKVETEATIDAAMSSHHKVSIEKLMNLIKKLSEFLSDTKNIEALSDYDKKPEADKNSCPLDVLCKDIFVKLRALELLLIDNTGVEQHSGINRNHKILTNEGSRNELTNVLSKLLSENLLSAFDILKYLSGHNRTLILLGANGSGKTSLQII